MWVNVSLYFNTQGKGMTKNHELIARLNFLEEELKQNDLGDRMQSLFPEGKVFVNALYGLSWCEVARQSDKSSDLYARSLVEARFAYSEIIADDCKLSFPIYLDPEYGIFYQGWSNYLLSNILDVQDSSTITEDEFTSSQYKCGIISDAIKSASSPYIETYQGQSWPADVSIAIASLSLVKTEEHKILINKWVEDVKQHLDEYTGMIPHKTNPATGETIEGARGCSSSLILRMLSEIDKSFADEQLKLYQNSFLFTRLGLPAIREYPKGKSGWGDIDSGPVVFGVGFAGTIVGVSAFQKLGHQQQADALYSTVTSFGFETKFGNEKHVLAGLLPMGDAFLTWSRLSINNNTMFTNYPVIKGGLGSWRLMFNLWSLLLMFSITLPMYLKLPVTRKRKK
ncbi:MAG: hypothetical protein ACJA0Q_001651 [Saprospiraceae bacterium]|jgi:hypothetical protein